MTGEQEAELFQTIGRLDERTQATTKQIEVLHSRISRMPDELGKILETKVNSLRVQPAGTNGTSPPVNGLTASAEDREALELGRTLKGLPRLGAALGKAWPVLIGFGLVGAKFAYDAWRAAP